VEAHLLSAFRSASGVRPKRTVSSWAGPIPVFGWLAAAGILVAAAAGIFLKGPGPQPRESAPPHRVISGTMLADAGEADVPDLLDGSLADDFSPAADAASLAGDEDLDLVRVEVPRSALIAAGVAPGPESGPDRVEADVLLGRDGLVRAVRFVN
jgi:hypothetical protein